MGAGGPASTSDPSGKTIPPLTTWGFIAATICFLGVQFGWAVQIGFTSPLFSELGVDKFWIGFVWLAGPISGLVVQPIVGVYSDRLEHRWGRRRPFIFYGMIFIVLGMLVISNAASLGELLGDSPGSRPIAITIAVLGFWILDLSNNTVQGPCRALLVDLAPPEQQETAGSFFAFMLALGNCAGYWTGSLDLATIFPFFGDQYRPLFAIGIVVLVSTVSVTLVYAKETPYVRPEGESQEQESVKEVFDRIAKGTRTMPEAMKRVVHANFASWVAWFAFILYATVWVAEDVFGGKPGEKATEDEHELYKQGERAAATGLMLQSVVNAAVSAALPTMVAALGQKVVWGGSQVLFGLCLAATPFLTTAGAAKLMFAATGVTWAVTMVIPYALTGRIVGPKESGLYMGVLNMFIVFPQLIVSVTFGVIIKLAGDTFTPALVAGSLFAFLSAALMPRLIIPSDDDDEDSKEASLLDNAA